MAKEITWIDDKLDELTNYQLATLMAEAKAVENQLKALRGKITDILCAPGEETEPIATPLGKVPPSQGGGSGTLYVKDVLAYGSWLAQHGHESLTVDMPSPVEEAMDKGMLKALRIENGGLPDGVAERPAKAASIMVRLDKDYLDKWTMNPDESLLLTGVKPQLPAADKKDDPQDDVWKLDNWSDVEMGDFDER